MKQLSLYNGAVTAGNIAAGCMRINRMTDAEADRFVGTCLDAGINLFDHADIYAGGVSEEVFGKALKRNKGYREKMILQTKCGIVPGVMFDFSKKHILTSVEGSLKRLGVESVDILLLHRPDTLMEPAEIEAAFAELSKSGKVKHFGVSNQTAGQMRFLQKNLSFPLLVNQLQFSAAHTGMVDQGLFANTKYDGATDRDGGILEHCRENGITIQAWSPFQYGFFGGVFIGDKKYQKLNDTLDKLAKVYNSTPSGIAVAFILRHPANMQVITGTTRPERVKEAAAAAHIVLDRKDWYGIWQAAGNELI